MGDTQFRYDAAISFAGQDRDTARKLALALKALGVRLFYDEWARAELLGKDLTLHLDTVYRFQAKHCIVLLSENYRESMWTQHELKSALGRSLKDREDYLLPVRLDDAEIPGVPDTIGFIRIDECSIEELAGVIAKKIQAASGGMSESEGASGETVWTSAPRTNHINGFRREPVSRRVRIADSDLISRAQILTPNEDPRARWKFAYQFARELSFFHDVSTRTAYTCWRDESRFFLSMLPGVHYGAQQTLEFEFINDDSALSLNFEWNPENEDWGAIAIKTFHATVKGLTADRSGCSMNRESIVYVLQKLGREFVFPVSPFANKPEPLCGWIKGTPTNGWVDYDRDPRIVGPQVVCWDAYFHNLSCEGILNFTVQGAWSNNALYAFYDALDFMLPTRHYRKLVDIDGCTYIRVSVHLGNNNIESIEPEDNQFATESLSRTYSCIARMCAAEDEVPVPEPDESSRLPPLSMPARVAFDEAMESLGERQVVREVQDYPEDDGTDSWGKLRHHWHLTRRIGIDEFPPFQFSRVVRARDVLAFIERHESMS